MEKEVNMKGNGNEEIRMEPVMLLNIIGIYYYSDGSKYDGKWKDDKRDGFGNKTIYYRNMALH